MLKAEPRAKTELGAVTLMGLTTGCEEIARLTGASSIDLWRSTRYGLGVLATTGRYVLARGGLRSDPLFRTDGGRLIVP